MKNTKLYALAALLLVAVVAIAADLTYTTLPQTTDTELVLQHKKIAEAASNKYVNITTSTTTAVKSGSGILEKLIVNTAGAGSTFTIYDNTAASGTKIATGSGAAQFVFPYGCRFATGLTVVTASGTPADITVVYR